MSLGMRMKKKSTATGIAPKKKREPLTVELTRALVYVPIKRCPFCNSELGGKPYLRQDGSGTPEDGPYWIQCGWEDCFAQGPQRERQQDAADAWNERGK
jgi:hypothetical protein